MASFGSPAAFLESQSAARINHQAQHKQDISDTELETNIGQANSNIDALQQKLGTLDPSSRDHAETMQALQQQLAARTQLFHPANNPGAIQKFGHLMGLGRKPATPVAPPTISTTPSIQLGQATLPEGPASTVQGPQTPAALKAQAQANMIAAGIPAPPAPALTPDEEREAARVKAGIQPKAAAPKAATPVNPKNVVWLKHPDGSTSPYQFADGKFVPVEGAEGLTPPVKAPAPSNSAFAVLLRSMYPDVKDGHYSADQVEQAMVKQKQLGSPDTTGTHDVITYDANGNATVNQLHTSSHKSFGGKHGSGSGGSTGGGTGAPASTGRPLLSAHRNTPAQTSAAKDYSGAVKLASFADQVLKNPTPQAQKQLALKLIKESAGRVNMQEYDIMTKRAGVANTLEAWANNVTSGALPDEIFRNLVDAAHKNLTAAKVARDEAYTPMDSATPGEMKDRANPAGGKSLADRLNDALGGK